MDKHTMATDGLDGGQVEQAHTADVSRVGIPGRNGGTIYPFVKGNCANPGGRRRGVRFPAEHLALTLPDMDPARILDVATGAAPVNDINLRIACRQAAVAAGMVSDARAIDTIKAAEFISDRTSGRPAQQITVQPAAEPVDGAELLARLRARVSGKLSAD